MKIKSLLLFIIFSNFTFANNEIETATILRFTCARDASEHDIVYYYSLPFNCDKFPIVVLCEGSSSKGDLSSVKDFHEYFKDRIQALGCGILTVEKWGIDGEVIDENEFWKHYTRSQRLADHMCVLEHIRSNCPEGWSGGIVLFGVSEGGWLVNQLSTICQETIATVNWVAPGDWNWADEFWAFYENERKKHPYLFYLYSWLPRCLKWLGPWPRNHDDYSKLVEYIKEHPVCDSQLGGMPYNYLADAFNQKPIEYFKIKAPMLVVSGALDSSIDSCDQFVSKAQKASVPVTYWRIEDMDHWIRKRPDVIEQSFDWLKQVIG